jgi:hypothetical protein
VWSPEARAATESRPTRDASSLGGNDMPLDCPEITLKTSAGRGTPQMIGGGPHRWERCDGGISIVNRLIHTMAHHLLCR